MTAHFYNPLHRLLFLTEGFKNEQDTLRYRMRMMLAPKPVPVRTTCDTAIVRAVAISDPSRKYLQAPRRGR